MENSILNQFPEAAVTYDYRMYDRIWQRVSPDLDPYPETRAAAASNTADPNAACAVPTPQAVPAPQTVPTPQSVPAPQTADVQTANAAAPVPASDTAAAVAAEAELPGAEMNPCCMGTDAQDSLEVLAGFIEEELAERRCCLTLCRGVRSAPAVRLLRRIAAEKQCAAREMCTAYYLITGTCYTPNVTVEHMQWENLAAAMRSCYHQEACNGFNYQRAAEGTLDPCLQKLFTRLSQQSYRRADDVMALLCQLLCQ